MDGLRTMGALVGIGAGLIAIWHGIKDKPPENAVVVATQAPVLSPEEQVWQAAERANTAPAFAEYVQAYPAGQYVGVAQARMSALEEQARQQAHADALQAEQQEIQDACLTYFQDHPLHPHRHLFVRAIVGGLAGCATAAAARSDCATGAVIGATGGGVTAPSQQTAEERAREQQAEAVDACMRGGGPPGFHSTPREEPAASDEMSQPPAQAALQ